MNSITDRTDAEIHKKKRGLFFASLGIAVLILAYIISITHTGSSTNQNPDSQIQKSTAHQYAILSPTNAILKYYNISEGERVSRSTLIAVMLSPDLENRLHEVADKVAEARMTLVQLRSSMRHTTPPQSQPLPKNSTDSPQILKYRAEIRKISLNLDALYARLELLKNAPFSRNNHLPEISAVEREIASNSALLDLARSNLEDLLENNTAQPVNSRDFGEKGDLQRKIITAKESLRIRENELKKIEAEMAEHLHPVTAPFAGTLVELSAVPGSFVRRGQPIAVILRTEQKH